MTARHRLLCAAMLLFAEPAPAQQYPAPLSPQDYAAYLREDLAKWRKVAAAARLQLQ